MKNTLKNYSLSIVLVSLFLLSWLGQGVFQWLEFANNQKGHGQEVKIEEFLPEFLASTFENWQSEFLQLLTFVVLTTYLIHKGSPESKDGDEEKKQMLSQIDKRLQKLEKGKT